MNTPIRYAGGKSKAFNLITQYLPTDIKTIVSPFIGGGSLESKWAETYQVIGADIFYPLINFWNVLLDKPNDLADALQKLTPDKETYKEIKEQLLCWSYTQLLMKDWKTDHYKRTPIELDELTSAAYYFFNHNLSYGPNYLGWMSKIYQDQDKWDKRIKQIRNYSNPNLSVYHQDFDVTIQGTNKFLYLDPPYFEEGKLFRAIYPNSNFPIHHKGFNHELLRDLLHSHKGRFVLSYNDCPTIREWYKDYKFVFPKWSYSMGNGETRREDNIKQSHEILIIKE